MTNPANTANTAPTPEETQELLEQARTEAQVRIAEVQLEEGTVKSEGAQNSPSPEDHD